MSQKIKPKDAHEIIHSLEAGIVPRRGIQHLLVGRNEEIKEVIAILNHIEAGGSDVRFWMGDFGSGKSFILRTIESLGIKKNFVISTLDLTPTRRFYATDGKGRALYQEIMNNIMTQSSQDGNGIVTIIETWINALIQEIAQEKNISPIELRSVESKKIVVDTIMAKTSQFNAGGLSYEIGQCIAKYYEGIVAGDIAYKLNVLRWIKGDIETKTEAKKNLGIAKIINDDNWFGAIKNLAELFRYIGYAGFTINFDEMVNIYKLPQRQTREKNYETLLNIFNDCKRNEVRGLFINFGVTFKTVFDEYRGISSYGALKGRLGSEKSAENELINTNKSVLPLRPLTPEEIYTLLDKLVDIYNTTYNSEIIIEAEDIGHYMEEQLNRPGARQFLTPRAVIKDYLEILDLKRQNPNYTIRDLIDKQFGRGQKPMFKDSDDLDDIEVF